jgi:hypothetical protein
MPRRQITFNDVEVGPADTRTDTKICPARSGGSVRCSIESRSFSIGPGVCRTAALVVVASGGAVTACIVSVMR